MGKRANPMAVKAALTYTVEEAAQAFRKNPATIRNWIKDGLPVMSSRKPYLMSGAALREYLRKKYHTAKRPLAAGELYCLHCKKGQKPVDMTVSLSQIGPKTSLLRGACDACDGTATRMVSQSQIDELARNFVVKAKAGSEA